MSQITEGKAKPGMIVYQTIDSSRACYYQLKPGSFANKSHGFSEDTWKDLPGHSMWHFMTEVPLD